MSGRHNNISPIYVTQKFQCVPKIIRENVTHLCLFNGGSSTEDISRIVRQYVDDPVKSTNIIKNYLRQREFIVFDLTKSETDPLAVRIRWDTPLDLSGNELPKLSKPLIIN